MTGLPFERIRVFFLSHLDFSKKVTSRHLL
jgi:hypothetical protein